MSSVGREMNLPKRFLECFYPIFEIESRELGLLFRIDSHRVAFREVDKPVVEGAVIRGRKSEAVDDVVGAAWDSHRKNMGSIHEPELHSGNSTTVPIPV